MSTAPEKKKRGRKPRKLNDEVININNNIKKDTSFTCDNSLDSLIVQFDKLYDNDIKNTLNDITKNNEFIYSPELNEIKPFNDDIQNKRKIKQQEEEEEEKLCVPFDPNNISQSIVNFTQKQTISSEETFIRLQNKTVKYKLTDLESSIFTSDNWPYKTDIHCWWCCHQFDSIPIGMPLKIKKNGTFQVIGCFCSFNCIIAYSNNNKHNNIGLIQSLFRKLLDEPVFKFYESSNKCESQLKSAPPRETLKIFGGNLTIEQFRDSFNHYKNYTILTLPMISIGQKIEEKEEFYITIGEDNKKIKRSKPLHKKEYTLEHLMGIQK